jgi:hypothetical protein
LDAPASWEAMARTARGKVTIPRMAYNPLRATVG